MRHMQLPLMGKNAITPFIPHRGNMLLLDGIVSVTETGLVAHATLDAASPLFFNGKTPGYVCFELVAQAISAFSHIKKYAGGETPSIGFILRVSNFEISRCFLDEDTSVLIEIEVETAVIDDLFSFRGKVSTDDGVVAQGSLLVMNVGDIDKIKQPEE